MDPRFRLLIQQQRTNTTGAVINNVNASQFGVSGIKNPITQQALTQQNSRPYENIQKHQQQQQQQLQQQQQQQKQQQQQQQQLQQHQLQQHQHQQQQQPFTSIN